MHVNGAVFLHSVITEPPSMGEERMEHYENCVFERFRVSRGKRRKSRWVNGNPKRETRKPCDAFCFANWSADKGQEVMVLVMGRRKFYYLSLFIRHIRSLLIFSFFETIFLRNSTVISLFTVTLNSPPVSSLKFRAIFWGESSIFFQFNSLRWKAWFTVRSRRDGPRWILYNWNNRTDTIRPIYIAWSTGNWELLHKIKNHSGTLFHQRAISISNFGELAWALTTGKWNNLEWNSTQWKLATNLKFLFRNEVFIWNSKAKYLSNHFY